MCGCIPLYFGLGYLTVWLNLPMYTALLMKLPLASPLTSASSCNTNYGTLFTTVVQSKIFLAPRSNTATVLALHSIVFMPLPNWYWKITKLSRPGPQYDWHMILSRWIVAVAPLFVMIEGRSKGSLLLKLTLSIPRQGIPLPMVKISLSALNSHMLIHWTYWYTPLGSLWNQVMLWDKWVPGGWG